MATFIFDKMLNDAAKAGIVVKNTKKSMDWFRAKALSVNTASVRPSKFTSQYDRVQATWMPGNMYMMCYDPKGKDTLPYYDNFPLILPYKRVPGGFYGLNLHYLPPTFRAKLMDALWTDRLNNQRFDDSTKMKLGAQAYRILNTGARYRWFKPCVKHYLNDHLRSPFIYIHPQEWQAALFLPSEQFRKATKEKVWYDSRKKINKG
jgi:hypothetical protein